MRICFIYIIICAKPMPACIKLPIMAHWGKIFLVEIIFAQRTVSLAPRHKYWHAYTT